MPAWADYSNGPINGTTDAWTINFGYVVSDSYVSDGNVTGFMFGVWEFPGDTLSSVDWSITSGENSGTIFGSGTASGANLTDKYISSNQYGYNIDLITVSGLNVAEVQRQHLLAEPAERGRRQRRPGLSGMRTAASQARPRAPVGTIPSEAFTINSSGSTSGSTPEPSSIMLFGSGILGLAGFLRRKLF